MYQWAGWSLCTVAALHLVLAGMGLFNHMDQLGQHGLLGTVNPPWIPEGLDRQVAFWVTLGSFAGPQLLLGSWVIWSAQRDLDIPEWIGPGLIILTVLEVMLAPVSGFWLNLLPGIMLCTVQRRASKALS